MSDASGPASPVWSGIPGGADKRQIVALIEAAIRDGRLPRGERLPTERAIAEASGLSRNTVRDALARLVDRGLIARQVGRGTFVADGAVAPGGAPGPERLGFWEAAPAPREQLPIDGLFQGVDPCADRRLSQVQRPGCSAEAAVPHDPLEGPKLVRIHATPSFIEEFD